MDNLRGVRFHKCDLSRPDNVLIPEAGGLRDAVLPAFGELHLPRLRETLEQIGSVGRWRIASRLLAHVKDDLAFQAVDALERASGRRSPQARFWLGTVATAKAKFGYENVAGIMQPPGRGDGSDIALSAEFHHLRGIAANLHGAYALARICFALSLRLASRAKAPLTPPYIIESELLQTEIRICSMSKKPVSERLLRNLRRLARQAEAAGDLSARANTERRIAQALFMLGQLKRALKAANQAADRFQFLRDVRGQLITGREIAAGHMGLGFSLRRKKQAAALGHYRTALGILRSGLQAVVRVPVDARDDIEGLKHVRQLETLLRLMRGGMPSPRSSAGAPAPSTVDDALALLDQNIDAGDERGALVTAKELSNAFQRLLPTTAVKASEVDDAWARVQFGLSRGEAARAVP